MIQEYSRNLPILKLSSQNKLYIALIVTLLYPILFFSFVSAQNFDIQYLILYSSIPFELFHLIPIIFLSSQIKIIGGKSFLKYVVRLILIALVSILYIIYSSSLESFFHFQHGN